jgi:hypothetical protein
MAILIFPISVVEFYMIALARQDLNVGRRRINPEAMRRCVRTNQLNLEELHAGVERHISPGATACCIQRIDQVRDGGQFKAQISVATAYPPI